MISTPDAVLQAVIKRSLVESGCPASIVNELIENAHERSWPQGLATLETRQMNRRYYENYVAKRIPGKQAVVVMACENQHMGDDMVQEPGLVMIFASPRGNPACRGTFGGRRKAVRDRLALQGGTGDFP